MTPARRRNLERLLKPRHVALIGGRDAEVVAVECARIGFPGPIWPVNRKRPSLGGHTCFASVEDLPEPPDAAFLAVPREAAIETIGRLRDLGAGGVVCYTAGFGEIGESGRGAERALIEAAGDMALVGPNCYGVISYLDRVALWPFAHGGGCPGFGAAIITQSGMLSSDLTMSQRSLPLTHMISAGNQAVLSLEDFLEALIDNPAVRAIGLHIEGLKDVSRFADASLKALEAGKPVVALKTGSSSVGARLTVSHTGSIAGSDSLYDALFDRLGVIRVATPSQMLETLKFAVVAGVPRGTRIAGFTCSGGGAAMLADLGEAHGMAFPSPSECARASLGRLLPEIATVSNPLDYTTPIWGNPDTLPPVLSALLSDGFDAAMMIQDYPLAGLDESKPFYRNDTKSFIAATRQAGIPAAVCSTISENLDSETRDFLNGQGVAPLQGIGEGVAAIAGMARFGMRRDRVRARDGGATGLGIAGPMLTADAGIVQLDEWQGKRLLSGIGIAVPEGRLAGLDDVAAAAEALGFPVALKLVHDMIAHKTEVGAVTINLTNGAAVQQEALRMQQQVVAHDARLRREQHLFLVERMVPSPRAELLAGIQNDPIFGPAMTLASGGILVELIRDAVTVLLPAAVDDIARALDRLKVSRLLEGYRGQPAVDRDPLIEVLSRLAGFACLHASSLVAIEINPLFVTVDRVVAIDVVTEVVSGTALARTGSQNAGLPNDTGLHKH